jgi:glucosamine--fructose-6-phosphate aminotransferase (isomerizing)
VWIVGYVGQKDCQDILIGGLERLEYRGYDSAGIAVINSEGSIDLCKSKGKLQELKKRLKNEPLFGTIGIAHTRGPPMANRRT